MQQAQRVRCNHALEYAVEQANRLGLPLLVGFGLTDGYPEANLRHYAFMLEGLAEVAEALAGRGIGFTIALGEPDAVAAARILLKPAGIDTNVRTPGPSRPKNTAAAPWRRNQTCARSTSLAGM